MKYLFLLILLLKLFPGLAQSELFNTPNITKDGTTLEAYDISMKRIPMGTNTPVEGSPMLNNEFAKGIVKFRTGQEYKDVNLNFSLASNRLYFRKDSINLEFINPVDYFALPVTTRGKEKMITFKSGFPPVASNTEKTFYEVLSNGAKVQLLKHVYKAVEDVLNHNGPVEKAYLQKERLYIYDVKQARMFEPGGSIKSLKKSLPQYEIYIDKYSSQNNINPRHEEDLIALIDYINAQP